jgi:hypothetical protein
MKNFWAAGMMAILLAQTAASQGVIRLKAGNISPAPVGSWARRETPPGAVLHSLVLFNSYPDADVRASFARRRIRVLAYVPDNTLMVSGPAPLNLAGLDVAWSGPLDPQAKISPVLGAQPAGAYLVIFQPDSALANDWEFLENQGFTVIENPDLLAAQLLVAGPASGLPNLAASDDVVYILPASVDLQSGAPVLGCAGPLAEAGPVAEYAQPVATWSSKAGAGITLGYFFDQLTEKLEASQVESEIARAFATWARYTNVSFTPAAVTQAARSIDILFASGAHGDAYPFDDISILAHTFYPAPPNPETIAGDMHFNDAESWHIGSSVDLYTVALHETGHALGLGHSDQPGDVMYPYYSFATGLAPGDIAAIQAVYGTTPGSVTPPSGTGTGTGSGSGSGTGGGSGSGSGGGTGTGTGSGGGSGSGSGTGSGGSGTGTKTTDTTPPSLTILSPASTMVSVSSSSIAISGTASDNVAVASVTWSTSNGDSGAATGTTSWSAVVPLLTGTNVVTVRAYDAAGNSAWRAVTVVRD